MITTIIILLLYIIGGASVIAIGYFLDKLIKHIKT